MINEQDKESYNPRNNYDKKQEEEEMIYDKKDRRNPQLTYNQKIKKIYDLYTQAGEGVYTSFMKNKKFFQLCTDIKIIDRRLNKTTLELMILKENKKSTCFDFTIFIKCLYGIAQLKYPEEENSFKILLDEYLLPHYDRLFNNQEQYVSVDYSHQNKFKQEKPKGCIMNKINNLTAVDDLFIHQDYQDMLISSANPLYQVYKVYFPFELSHDSPNDYSIKQFIKVLTDFSLFPHLVVKDEVYQIYQKVIDSDINDEFSSLLYKSIKQQNIGNYFTFFHFIIALFHIADIGLDKVPLSAYIDNGKEINRNSALYSKVQNKYTVFEKICLILERMEFSEVFPKLNLKPQTGIRIINPIFLNKVKKDIEDKEQFLIEHLNKKLKKDEMVNNSFMTKQQASFKYYQYIFGKYCNELHYIYKLYLDEGEFLRATKFKKMVSDAGLLRTHDNQFGIKSAVVDLIYTKMTRAKEKESSLSSSLSFENDFTINQMTSKCYQATRPMTTSNGMNLTNTTNDTKAEFTFQTFINVVEIFAKKLFPSLDILAAIDKLCEDYLFRLCVEDEANILDKIYILRDNEIFEQVYDTFFKTIEPLFSIYAKKTGLVDIKSFFRFCHDFSLFPQSLTKSKVNSIFKNTFTYGKEIKEDMDNIQKIGLDQALFCDVLVQIAFEIKYCDDELEDIEKVISFADRLAQSNGIEQIIVNLLPSTKLTFGKNFDLMNLFKKNYPAYFIEEKKEDNYHQVLNEIA